MGTDIHSYVERQRGGTWRRVRWGVADAVGRGKGPFDERAYAVFGWLAGVCNYSAVPPVALPRGLPADCSRTVQAAYDRWKCDHHDASWLAVHELVDFDYEATVEDRWAGRGGLTLPPGAGRQVSYRHLLGQRFFRDLDRLEHMNTKAPTRVVFWFDS